MFLFPSRQEKSFKPMIIQKDFPVSIDEHFDVNMCQLACVKTEVIFVFLHVSGFGCGHYSGKVSNIGAVFSRFLTESRIKG